MKLVEPPLTVPTWGSRLDAAIAAFFPAWALERQTARLQMAAIEKLGFRAARHSRLDRDVPAGGMADFHAELTYDRPAQVNRARQLERDSVLAESLLSRSVENVVGCGFKLKAASRSEKWNEKVEDLWSDWGEHEADVRGLSTWDELMALAYRSRIRDGDCGAILLADGKIQMFEADQLVSPSGISLRRGHVDGIDLDRRGRPTQFHIVDDPDPIISTFRSQITTPIPAQEVAYMARRKRLGQTRGISAFSNVAWLLDQIDGNIEAVTVAARMAACFGMVIKTHTKWRSLATTTNTSDGNSRRKLRLEPGGFLQLQPGEDAVPINPAQSTQNFSEFLTTLSRFVGLAFGLPLELTLMDSSKTSFSSWRGAMLMAYRVWQTERMCLRRWAAQIYRWKVINWIREGRLAYRSDALKHSWIMPPWEWIDPEKGLKAALAMRDAGLITHSELLLRMGGEFAGDFARFCEARKAELETLAEAGIPEKNSTLTRDPNTGTANPGPDEPKEDDDES